MSQKRVRKSEKSIPVWASVRCIVKLSGRLQGLLYLALVMCVISAVFVVAMNHFMRRALDTVPSGDSGQFWFYIGVVVSCWVTVMPLV